MAPRTGPGPGPTTTTTTSWSGTRAAFPKRTARAILRRDTTCQLDYPGVCTTTPTQADHITPHAEAILLGWSIDQIDAIDNGQGVCAPCHKIKTNAEQARGRARAATARPKQRPAPAHPGLRQP